MNHLITELNLNDYPECIICLDNFVLHEPVILTSCGHIFHKKCVDPVLQKNMKCPFCNIDHSI